MIQIKISGSFSPIVGGIFLSLMARRIAAARRAPELQEVPPYVLSGKLTAGKELPPPKLL